VQDVTQQTVNLRKSSSFNFRNLKTLILWHRKSESKQNLSSAIQSHKRSYVGNVPLQNYTQHFSHEQYIIQIEKRLPPHPALSAPLIINA